MTSAISDKRWTERQNVRLGVTLIDNGEEILHAISKDISIGGIFIDTSSIEPPLNRLDTDKKFSVTFTLRSATGEQHHALPARIIRSHSGGTALAFSDYDINALNALRILLYDGSGTH